jgi:hypothetical protein
MTSAAAHSRWPLRMSAILDLVSVDYLTNPWVDWSNFLGGFIGGAWRKVPVDDQRLRSFKMATTAAILDWFPLII